MYGGQTCIVKEVLKIFYQGFQLFSISVYSGRTGSDLWMVATTAISTSLTTACVNGPNSLKEFSGSGSWLDLFLVAHETFIYLVRLGFGPKVVNVNTCMTKEIKMINFLLQQ